MLFSLQNDTQGRRCDDLVLFFHYETSGTGTFQTLPLPRASDRLSLDVFLDTIVGFLAIRFARQHLQAYCVMFEPEAWSPGAQARSAVAPFFAPAWTCVLPWILVGRKLGVPTDIVDLVLRWLPRQYTLPTFERMTWEHFTMDQPSSVVGILLSTDGSVAPTAAEATFALARCVQDRVRVAPEFWNDMYDDEDEYPAAAGEYFCRCLFTVDHV